MEFNYYNAKEYNQIKCVVTDLISKGDNRKYGASIFVGELQVYSEEQ